MAQGEAHLPELAGRSPCHWGAWSTADPYHTRGRRHLPSMYQQFLHLSAVTNPGSKCPQKGELGSAMA
jgi:hypothetical protein